MKILIIHSASSNLVKKIASKYENKNVYIITFHKNKGIFKGLGKEIYFNKDSNRINAYGVIDDIQFIINEKQIDCLIGLCSNENGENYENIKTLLNLSNVTYKQLYNNKLQAISYQNKAIDYSLECLYSNENTFTPLIGNVLTEIKKNTKVKVGNINKILFIYDRYSIGGIANLIYSWGNKLIDNGNEVLFACYSNGDMFKKFKNSKIKEFICKEHIKDSGANFDYYEFLFDLINNEKPNIVIIVGITTILPSIIATVLSKKSKIFLMVNGECHEVFDSKPYGLYLRSFKDIFDKIICVSNHTGESVVNLGIDKSKVCTIYGTNITIKNTIKKFKHRKNVITYIGRLSKEKGVDIFIRSIGLLRKDSLERCRIRIIGNGEEEDNLRKLSKELEIEKYIFFEGYKEDDKVSEILNESDIFVLPSYTEGLPLALLEAMSQKVFCIASNVGGIGEVLKDKINGFTIKSGEYTELASKIEYALNNKRELERMTEDAFNDIKKNFTVEKSILDLQNLFMEIGD